MYDIVGNPWSPAKDSADVHLGTLCWRGHQEARCYPDHSEERCGFHCNLIKVASPAPRNPLHSVLGASRGDFILFTFRGLQQSRNIYVTPEKNGVVEQHEFHAPHLLLKIPIALKIGCDFQTGYAQVGFTYAGTQERCLVRDRISDCPT